MKESLNAYKNAYHNGFKFHDENMLMLSWYSERIVNTIRNNKYKSLASLGIGHKIVCNKIIDELRSILEKYIIIEGASEIISELKSEVVLPVRIKIVNSLFEEYTTDQKFDAIEMGFVLEHVDDPLHLIKHFVKYLKDGGRLFVAVPNARSLHRLIGCRAGLLDDLFKLSTSDLELGHKRYFDVESLTRLLTAAEVRILNMEGIYLKPFSAAQLQSLQLPADVMKALCEIGIEYPAISNAIYIEATI